MPYTSPDDFSYPQPVRNNDQPVVMGNGAGVRRVDDMKVAVRLYDETGPVWLAILPITATATGVVPPTVPGGPSTYTDTFLPAEGAPMMARWTGNVAPDDWGLSIDRNSVPRTPPPPPVAPEPIP